MPSHTLIEALIDGNRNTAETLQQLPAAFRNCLVRLSSSRIKSPTEGSTTLETSEGERLGQRLRQTLLVSSSNSSGS